MRRCEIESLNLNCNKIEVNQQFCSKSWTMQLSFGTQTTFKLYPIICSSSCAQTGCPSKFSLSANQKYISSVQLKFESHTEICVISVIGRYTKHKTPIEFVQTPSQAIMHASH